MKHIFSVWHDEYRTIFSDAGVLLLFVGAILLYPFFTSSAYITEVLKDIPVAVIDLDHSQLSRTFIRMLDAHESLEVDTSLSDMTDARGRLLERKFFAIISIPHDFQKKTLRNTQAVISVLCDASYFYVYQQTKKGIAETAGTLSARIEVQRLMAQGMPPAHALNVQNPFSLLPIPLYNPSGGYASYAMPAVMVMVLQMTLLMGIGMLGGTAREHMQPEATDTTSHAAGVTATIIGKGGAYLTLYAVHAVFFFAVLYRFFGFPQRGDFLDAALFTLPFLLAVIFLGLTLVALFRERELSVVGLIFVSVPGLFMVGFSWPVESMPSWIRMISLLLPSTAGIDGFIRIHQMGATLQDVSFDVTILWGLAMLYFTTACVVAKYLRLKE